MKKALAIFKKQILDTLKNTSVLLQFFMFPVLAFILTKTIGENIGNLPKNYFIIMFSSMYVGMSPAVAMESIISEEKEKGTLKNLLMNNVKPGEYLIGVGIYVFIMCLIGTSIFAFAGGYIGNEVILYFAIMIFGILASMLLGASIGIISKNQMSGHSIVIPITIMFAFLPLISSFNKKVANISKFTYSQRIHDMLSNVKITETMSGDLMIVSLNILVLLFVFTYFYKNKFVYSN